METAVQITVALSIAVLVNALMAEMLMVATVEMPTAETQRLATTDAAHTHNQAN